MGKIKVSARRLKANRENAKKGGRHVSKSTLYAQQFREALAKQIMEDSKSWLKAIEDAAKGHYVIKQTENGEVTAYKKSPDPVAWEKAMNRAFGKPQESVDITTQGEKIGKEMEHERLLEMQRAIKNLGLEGLIDLDE